MHGLAAAFAVTLTLAVGCGGESTLSRDDARSGDAGAPTGGMGTTGGASMTGGSTSTGGAGPTGGALPTGGASGTGPTEECRIYASRFTRTAGQTTLETECDFDRPGLTLRCTTTDNVTTTTSWDTIDDVLADNRPVGHFTSSRRTWDDGSCFIAETVGYDVRRLPEAVSAQAVSASPEQSCGHESLVYDLWDGQGRPKRALVHMVWSSPPIELCSGEEETYDYFDDTNMMVESHLGGMGLSCDPYLRATTFDPDGLLVREHYESGVYLQYDYTTLETASICRD